MDQFTRSMYKDLWEKYYSQSGLLILGAICFFAINCLFYAISYAVAHIAFKLLIPFAFNIIGYIYFVLLYNNTKHGIQLRYDEYNAFDDDLEDAKYEWHDVKPFGFIPAEFTIGVFVFQSLSILVAVLYIIFQYPWNKPALDIIKFAPFIIITILTYFKSIYTWIDICVMKDDYKNKFKNRYSSWKL